MLRSLLRGQRGHPERGGMKSFRIVIKLSVSYVPTSTDVQEIQVPVLLPHEVLHAIACAGAVQVSKSLTGTFDRPAIREFWTHVRQLEEWKNHPLFASSTSEELGCTIPLIFHVDGAEFYTNSEYLVWSFSSALSSGDVWDIKFPMVVLPHSAMHEDGVAAEVHRRVAKLAAWSLKHAAKGIFPDKGMDGEEFHPKTLRFKMKGEPLGLGWRPIPK